MGRITIRNVDPSIKGRLRVRAAIHGLSIEAEARRILYAAFGVEPPQPMPHLYERVRARFGRLGGANVGLRLREPAREPPRIG